MTSVGGWFVRSHSMVVRIPVQWAARLVALAVGLLCASVTQAAPPRVMTPSRAAAVKAARQTAAPSPAVRAPSRARYRRPADPPIPRFKIDATGALVPDVRAAAAIIYNPLTQQVLWEENSQDPRSIASITKVMTATVLLEADPDLAREVVVDRSDTRAASTTCLRAGDRVTIGDLVHLLLISSDNAAARTLARTSPWGPEGFVDRMNEKARELGLHSTHYADPSGLLPENVSSAYEMARLIAYAAADDRISEVMRKPEYQFWKGRRLMTIQSTNQLLRRTDLGDVDVRAGKTGFIAKSGYCFATLLGLPEFKQQVAVVVLGAKSNAGRFLETRNILTWLTAKARDLFPRDHEF
jgi:serine-type D-Ala-D-Ala endopeptidase (penicillin-binding protein 7)